VRRGESFSQIVQLRILQTQLSTLSRTLHISLVSRSSSTEIVVDTLPQVVAPLAEITLKPPKYSYIEIDVDPNRKIWYHINDVIPRVAIPTECPDTLEDQPAVDLEQLDSGRLLLDHGIDRDLRFSSTVELSKSMSERTPVDGVWVVKVVVRGAWRLIEAVH
jgi:hypothetical protein